MQGMEHRRREPVLCIARPNWVSVEAANNDRVTLAATAVNDVDAGNISQRVGKFGEALLFDLISTNRSNVQWNILHAFGAAGGGHDNRLLTRFGFGFCITVLRDCMRCQRQRDNCTRAGNKT